MNTATLKTLRAELATLEAEVDKKAACAREHLGFLTDAKKRGNAADVAAMRTSYRIMVAWRNEAMDRRDAVLAQIEARRAARLAA